MVRTTFLFLFLQLFGIFCLAKSVTGSKDSSSVLKQFEGVWHPDKPGWHGIIVIKSDGEKLYLTMKTDEGDKHFVDVEVNESEPSIEWSYCEESNAYFYIGKWRESNRDEIIVDVNHIYASCGVPTEIYSIGVEANHSVKTWKYMAVMADGNLIINFGYKWDFIAPSGEMVFMKSERYMSAFTYRKLD